MNGTRIPRILESRPCLLRRELHEPIHRLAQIHPNARQRRSHGQRAKRTRFLRASISEMEPSAPAKLPRHPRAHSPSRPYPSERAPASLPRTARETHPLPLREHLPNGAIRPAKPSRHLYSAATSTSTFTVSPVYIRTRTSVVPTDSARTRPSSSTSATVGRVDS